MERGYGEQGVRRQLREGLKMGREEALKRVLKRKDERINLVLTHSAYFKKARSLFKGRWIREVCMWKSCLD